tara:strand:+ start:297 stop:1064 length:768 start_codon:yes stop_codon:yes gene_type:complete
MQLIKRSFKLGNSAAVHVPIKWIDKQILVKPLEEDIIETIIKTLREKNLLENVKTIYLTGSYARGDYDEDSDIDIIVITDNKTGLLKEDNYEITLIPEKNYLQSLENNIYAIASLKDAKSLLNKELLDHYKTQKLTINIKKILNENQKVLELNEEDVLEYKDNNKPVDDGTIYSIILRLRQLYYLKKILKKQPIKKQELLSHMDKSSYNAYLRIKNNQKPKDNTKPSEVLMLIELTKKWIEGLKKQKKVQKVFLL